MSRTFVGKTAFAAVNLIMPVPMLVGSVGFMLGTGGSAIVGITLGEGDREKADRYFSLFVWTGLILGIVLSAVGVLIVRPGGGAAGRRGRDAGLCRPLWPHPDAVPAHLYFAEYVPEPLRHRRKAPSGLRLHGSGGPTNMVLDVVLVGMLHGGVEGAAIATFISQAVGGVLPVFYFLNKRSTSSIHLAAPSGTAASSAAPASTAPRS